MLAMKTDSMLTGQYRRLPCKAPVQPLSAAMDPGSPALRLPGLRRLCAIWDGSERRFCGCWGGMGFAI